jgi:pimeloyl-ACP methyl ester carboxylesterase
VRPIAVHLDEGWRRHADPAWLEGWTPRAFELAGGVTEVVALGEGPPLLLLPPLPGYKEVFAPCARLLARRFRVVTFDLRARFDRRPRWEALLDDLDRVADAFAPGAAIVVGHSLGGALAQRRALARPERVRALVLSSAFARVTTPRGHWRSRYVDQLLTLAALRCLPERRALAYARGLAARSGWVFDPQCDDRVLAFVRFAVRRVPLALAAACVRLAMDHDARSDLPRIACPTLVLAGERESAFVRDAADELVRLIHDARLAISPGAGHLHPLSNAAWFAETIAAWVGAGVGVGSSALML